MSPIPSAFLTRSLESLLWCSPGACWAFPHVSLHPSSAFVHKWRCYSGILEGLMNFLEIFLIYTFFHVHHLTLTLLTWPKEGITERSLLWLETDSALLLFTYHFISSGRGALEEGRGNKLSVALRPSQAISCREFTPVVRRKEWCKVNTIY